MKRALIVGGGGAAGRSALAALRDLFRDAEVVGTTSGSVALEGYDRTITGVDLSLGDAVETVRAQVGNAVDVLIFTPAFGPLGFPVSAATEDQVEEALRFSVRPMELLAEKLAIPLTISFSAFYWLPHTLAAYGSMAYAKLAQERRAVESPQRFRVVRAGTFRSKATRGITILLQRQMRSGSAGPGQELIDAWQASGQKFADFFFDYAFQSERRAFGERFGTPHRDTEAGDLKRGLTAILSGKERAPILNVIGDWQWSDSALPPLGPEFQLSSRTGSRS